MYMRDLDSGKLLIAQDMLPEITTQPDNRDKYHRTWRAMNALHSVLSMDIIKHLKLSCMPHDGG
jgi:hypothetical protein